jgi:hypothetical protein
MYQGAACVDYRGVSTPNGSPVRFEWRKVSIPIAWQVKWFAYDPKTQEPRTQHDAFQQILSSSTPIKSETPLEINYAWGGALGEGLPSNHFATLATGEAQFPTGAYDLKVTSDDGVRAFIDGKKVLENWTWHGPTLDTVTVKLGGRHTIRVEHFEIDGFATLKVELTPKRSAPAAASGVSPRR